MFDDKAAQQLICQTSAFNVGIGKGTGLTWMVGGEEMQ